jgi:hypothetical protein
LDNDAASWLLKNGMTTPLSTRPSLEVEGDVAQITADRRDLDRNGEACPFRISKTEDTDRR